MRTSGSHPPADRSSPASGGSTARCDRWSARRCAVRAAAIGARWAPRLAPPDDPVRGRPARRLMLGPRPVRARHSSRWCSRRADRSVTTGRCGRPAPSSRAVTSTPIMQIAYPLCFLAADRRGSGSRQRTVRVRDARRRSCSSLAKALKYWAIAHARTALDVPRPRAAVLSANGRAVPIVFSVTQTTLRCWARLPASH